MGSYLSDLFSLGIVLYEMATGWNPYQGDSNVETLDRIIRHEVLPPSQFNPAISAGFESLVLQMLEKDPLLRPTASEVYLRLVRLSEEVGEVPSSIAVDDCLADAKLTRHTVGRDTQLSELHEALRRAAAGQGGMVCLAGEAAANKPRFGPLMGPGVMQ